MPRLKRRARRLPPPVTRVEREREEPLLARRLLGLVSASRAQSLRYAHLCRGASLKSVAFVQQLVDQLVADASVSRKVRSVCQRGRVKTEDEGEGDGGDEDGEEEEEEEEEERSMPAPVVRQQRQQRRQREDAGGGARDAGATLLLKLVQQSKPVQQTQQRTSEPQKSASVNPASTPSEHPPSNALVPKRRPGRPPGSKNKKPIGNPPHANPLLVSPIRKRRPGRPPGSKNKIKRAPNAPFVQQLPHLHNVAVKRRPGRPPGSKNKKKLVHGEQPSQQLQNAAPKRKPGRPLGSKNKKYSTIENHSAHNLPNGMPKRKPGRPPGSKNKKPSLTAEQSALHLPNGAVPKKKRLGRPPGSKNKQPSAAAHQSAHDLPNGVPQKRLGRPPGSKNKHPPTNIAQSKQELSSTTNGIHKNRLGRPPANNNNKHPVANPERGLRMRTIDQPEKRRRASRPPKKSFLTHRRIETSGRPKRFFPPAIVHRPVVAEPQPVFTAAEPVDDYDSDVSSDVILEVDRAYCIVCGGRNASDKLILCDACSSGCHTYCARPARKTVPLGSWMCPTCFFVARKHVVPLPYMDKLRQGHCVICVRKRRFEKDQAPVKVCSDCLLHFHRDCLRQYASDFADDMADPDWVCQACHEYHEEKEMWQAQQST